MGSISVTMTRGDQQLAQLVELIETVDAGGGLFRDAAPTLDHGGKDARLALGDFLEQVLDDLFLMGGGGSVDPIAALLHLVAFVQKQRHVASIVDHQLRAGALRVAEGAPGQVPIFLEGLALPGEDRHTCGCDGRSGMVLSGEDITGCPADGGTQLDQRLNQDGGLDGHVQRAGDAHALKRLLWPELAAQRHQARHLVLGDGNFLATPLGESEVLDVEIS